jgi:hypothetical protein
MLNYLQWIEHIIFIFIIIKIATEIKKKGLKKFLLSNIMSGIKSTSITKKIYKNVLNNEVESGLKDLELKLPDDIKTFSKIPEKPLKEEEILDQLVIIFY